VPAPTNASSPSCDLDLLMRMLAIPGPSGHERKIIEFIASRLRRGGVPGSAIITDSAHRRSPLGGEIGNLIVKLPGTVRQPRRMLVAHVDTVPICVGAKPVRRGGWIESAKANTGLGADNRSGAAVILSAVLHILKHKLPHPPLTLLFTVQEEVGLRGAITSAYHINPDIGIAVDVGFTSDYPGGDPKKVGDIALGKGPILHRGANINPVLGRLLCDTARRKKIKFQMQAEPHGTGTDANAMQLSRGGCAAALVSVPNRYMHSPVEVVSLRDLDAAVTLIAETVLALTDRENFIPS